jgi:hypothetical protein
MLRIFFSWQSDLPKLETTSAIRSALKQARFALEQKYVGQDLSILLDEATRDEAGSPNIPDTVLKKIAQCDIFIADVSLINAAFASGAKLTPNPNVTFELGHAVGQVGWNRVVLLLNTDYGPISELPFDFDRHRVSQFSCGDDQNRSRLDDLMRVAIEAIIVKTPAKPNFRFDPALARRERDIRTLSNLLTHVPWAALRTHFDNAPKVISPEVLAFWDRFEDFTASPTYSIYDSQLNHLIADLWKHWHDSTSHGARYERLTGDDYYTFTYSEVSEQRKREEEDWDLITQQLLSLHTAMRAIIAYLKEHYVEIDLEEREQAAWDSYRAAAGFSIRP